MSVWSFENMMDTDVSFGSIASDRHSRDAKLAPPQVNHRICGSIVAPIFTCPLGSQSCRGRAFQIPQTMHFGPLGHISGNLWPAVLDEEFAPCPFYDMTPLAVSKFATA